MNKITNRVSYFNVGEGYKTARDALVALRPGPDWPVISVTFDSEGHPTSTHLVESETVKYVNVFEDGLGGYWNSVEAADSGAPTDRVGLLKLRFQGKRLRNVEVV